MAQIYNLNTAFDTNSLNECKLYYLNSFNDNFNYYYPNDLVSTFSVIHINARSIFNKLDDLKIILKSFPFSFSAIAITETWLNENTAPLVRLEGYTFLYR